MDIAIEIDTRTTIGSRVRIHCAVRLPPQVDGGPAPDANQPPPAAFDPGLVARVGEVERHVAGEVFVEAAGIQAQDRAVDNAGDGRMRHHRTSDQPRDGRAATRLARAVRTSVSIRSTSTLSAARPDLVSW